MAPLLIKKYSNRRLYDTSDSQYITLEQLEDRIRAGADVRVMDAQTGEDLTQVTLLQIIEKNGASRLLPVPLLLQLVRMRDDEALAEFLGRYMAAAMEAYHHAKQGLQSLSPYVPFATVPVQATSALARLLQNLWAEPSYGPHYSAMQHGPPSAPPPPALEPASSSEVAELRRELDELKRAMKKRKAR